MRNFILFQTVSEYNFFSFFYNFVVSWALLANHLKTSSCLRLRSQFMWRYQTILANPRDSSRARVRLHCTAIWSMLCNKLCCACCVHQKSENLNFWSKRKVVFVFTAVLDVQTRNCCKLASFPNEDEKRSQSSFFDVMHNLRSLNFNCC